MARRKTQTSRFGCSSLLHAEAARYGAECGLALAPQRLLDAVGVSAGEDGAAGDDREDNHGPCSPQALTG